MPFIDVEQNSGDWLRMRAGSVTASHLCDVLAKLKPIKEGKPNPKEAAARLVYKKMKRYESRTGMTADQFVSPYMDKGLEYEVLAREAYAMARDVDVLHGGLFVHDSIPRFMASPDGRVGEGLIEIKYLSGFTTEANHEDLLEGADIPNDYKLQMLGQMACSGCPWVDFVSYSPFMPKEEKLFIKRFPRDEKRIAEIEAEVRRFLAELDQMTSRRDLTAILEASVAEVAK